MSQQYSLRWNNHQPNFISMFTMLLNTQSLVDVTLAAEGKHLKAHKIVLSACSTYFQSLFVDNPTPHPIVIVKDVTFADLQTMVDFMYYGQVNVTEEQLPKVLDTAKVLKVKGLTEMPETTSLTRSQGISGDFQVPMDTEPIRHPPSPAHSPNNKRRRRRKSSGSASVTIEENRNDNMRTEPMCTDPMRNDSVRGDEIRSDNHNPTMDLVRDTTITLSNLSEARCEYQDERTMDDHQAEQVPPPLNVEPMMESTSSGITHGGQWGVMEQVYPRYTNCAGGSLQPDPGMYLTNIISPHLDSTMNEFGQSLAVPGPGSGPACSNDTLQQDPTPTRRRRAFKPQAEENFKRALEAVRYGGIGFCKAARMFGVNNRTLWLEYKKRGYPNTRPSIKSRIKREQPTPTPPTKKEPMQPDQQMVSICPPYPGPVSFMDTRPVNLPIQSVAHNSALNILGINFNPNQ